MTPEEQAQQDEIDRKRRRREALLLLLLLGFYRFAQRLINGTLEHGGGDPLAAFDAAMSGNRFAGKLSNALADVHMAAVRTTLDHATQDLPVYKGPPPGSMPSKADVANGYKPFATGAVDEIRQNVRQLVNDTLARVRHGDVVPTIDIVTRTMREVFESRGYTARNPAQARTQAVTLASKAWSAGAFAGWRMPGLWEAVRGFAFVTVRDEHVCPVCEPRDGLSLDRDDPYWLTNWPLLHWRCRCLCRPLWGAFTPTVIPEAPPPSPGFGLRPDLATGYTFNGTR